jgi:NitT/TauT family transport system permease protein
VRKARLALVAVFWLAVWQAVAMALGNQLLLVGPVEAGATLLASLPQGAFWAAVGNSLLRVLGGFLLAAALGTALAWLACRSDWTRDLLSAPILAIRSVPVVSFIILALIWTDSSWLSLIVSFLMVLPVVYSNAVEGIARRDRKLDELARVFDMGGAARWWAITLPRMLPYLIAACRTGIGLAWKAGVSAEVIGLPSGSIGERLYQAKLFLSTADLFAWTAVVVALSFACEKLVLAGLAALEKSLSGRYSRDPA